MDFSYFDQYLDTEIDLTDYLTKLSTIGGETYAFNNLQPVKVSVKNLFTHYQIIFDYKRNVELIIRYDVKDNESIELVSYNTYGSVEYWWIVALFNDIKNPFTDWPLSINNLKALALNLYEKEGKYSFDTYIQYLNGLNDERKKLTLPKPDTLKEIIWKYRQEIVKNQ